MTEFEEIDPIASLTMIKVFYEEVFGFKNDLKKSLSRNFVKDLNNRINSLQCNIQPLAFEIDPESQLICIGQFHHRASLKLEKITGCTIPGSICDYIINNPVKYFPPLFAAIKAAEKLVPQFVQATREEEVGISSIRGSLEFLPSEWEGSVYFINFPDTSPEMVGGYLIHNKTLNGFTLEWKIVDSHKDTEVSHNCINKFVETLNSQKKGI
ncbi:hypothetical protein CF8_0192 [Aeromonas phage CF8]|nr:hypothetical protein CF8_0192 [Aeromonas phage CF8]